MSTYLNVFGVVLAVLGAIFLTIYSFFQYSYTYWKRKGVIGPKPSFPEGNFRGVYTKKIHASDPVEKFYKQYKSEPYIGVYTLNLPVLIVNDLDLIKTILIKDFDHFDSHGSLENEELDPLSVNLFQLSGERWKDMRIKLSPMFTSGKMKIMTDIMLDVQKRLRVHIDDAVKRDPVLNIKEVFELYTMDLIGSCGFGIECESLKNPKSKFVKYGREGITPTNFKAQITFLLAFLSPWILEWLRMSAISRATIEFFTQLVEETVRYRELNNVKRNDLLQQLMLLKNDELRNDSGELVQPTGRKFTTVDLIAQTFVFLVAGYETSSAAASYALHWLARRPELQRRARDEVLTVLARHDGSWSYEALQQLDYVTMIIEETLRLHPALNFLFRTCTKSYKMPDSSLTVDKGTRVYIPVIGVHTDPDIYPEPHEFRPERFTREEKAKRHKSAYIPFGDGPRLCIGMRFAMMQVKLALAGVLAGYEVSVCDKTVIPLQKNLDGLVTSPRGGVFLRFQNID